MQLVDGCLAVVFDDQIPFSDIVVDGAAFILLHQQHKKLDDMANVFADGSIVLGSRKPVLLIREVMDNGNQFQKVLTDLFVQVHVV